VHLATVARRPLPAPPPTVQWTHRAIADHLATTGISTSRVDGSLPTWTSDRTWCEAGSPVPRTPTSAQGRRGLHAPPPLPAGLAGPQRGREDRDAGPFAQASDSPEFTSAFAQFEKSVLAHAEHEEPEEFPAIRAQCSDEEHQKIMGPFAAMVGEVRAAAL